MHTKLLYKTLCGLVFSVIPSHAVTSFVEHFDSGNANWRLNSSTAATQVIDGSNTYITVARNFESLSAGSGAVLLRAQDEFNSSNHAFEGNYLTDGVISVSALFRHNLPEAAELFVRFANPNNFPGATAEVTSLVSPNVWTPITIQINAANSEFVTFEGSDFNTIFSNIGHLQFGVNIPASVAGTATNYGFDLDTVSIVATGAAPEPSSLFLFSLTGLLIFRRRR